MNLNNYLVSPISSSDLEETTEGYLHVARGVLQRLRIHPDERDFSSILGDCRPGKNLDAVAEWIFELDPTLKEFGRYEIEYFTDSLLAYLDEFANHYN